MEVAHLLGKVLLAKQSIKASFLAWESGSRDKNQGQELLTLCSFLRLRFRLLASRASPTQVTAASEGLPSSKTAIWLQMQKGFHLSRVSPGTATMAMTSLVTAGRGSLCHIDHIGA